MLHNEKDAFEQLVLRTSDYLGVKAEIVEKDYFVTIFLKRIAAVMPDIVFKGGTSLSKCYHIIKRFSEDIDLNVQSEKKPSESKRKQLKANITKIISDLDFGLTNADSIKSRRDYNRYIIDYPSSLSAAYLRCGKLSRGRYKRQPFLICRKATVDSIRVPAGAFSDYCLSDSFQSHQ